MGVYEAGAGSALAQVEGFCRHLTTSGQFSDGSQPSRGWVESQLNLDSAYIAAKLGEAGYSPSQTDTDVLQLLQLWNVLRTVVSVELANPISSPSGRGNARFQEFKNREETAEKIATGPGLADLGATVSGGLSELLLATGVSQDRKDTVEDDSDHIAHRFRKGQFVHPSSSDPTAEPDWVDNNA